MNLEIVGAYLDRQVELSGRSELSGIDQVDCASSLTLIWICNPDWNVDDLQSAINALASRKALGITVAGERTDESFSVLLDTLSRFPNPHIMTGISREEDEFSVVEEFLVAALPSEERFDEWHGYNVIVVGDENALKRMREALKRFLSRSL
jgi:hypothetical protein